MQHLFLLTGATGHLGQAVARQLLAEGQRVRALVLPGDPLEPFLPKGDTLEIFYGDLLDKEALAQFFEAPAHTAITVLHCAGIVTTSMAYVQKVWDVNVWGTRNMLQQALRTGVGKFVYTSSVHAIPEKPKGQVTAETKDFSPKYVHGPYAKTKAAATLLALRAAGAGLNLSVVHPSGIVGPYDFAGGYTSQVILDYLAGRLPAGVDGGYDFADVRDVAAGVIAAARQGRPGEPYILCNRFITIREFFTTLRRLLGKPGEDVMVPYWLAKTSAPLLERYYKWRQQKPIFSPYSLYTLASNSLYSSDKARRELGYRTRPFMETLADTVGWLQENKM